MALFISTAERRHGAGRAAAFAGPSRFFNACLSVAAMLILVPAALTLPASSEEGPSREAATQRIVPRTIIGLYEVPAESSWRDHPFHRMLEMPLENSGLVLEPYDVNQPLPDLAQRDDVRGVLTWFDSPVNDPAAYLDWAGKALDAKLPYVVIGDFGLSHDDPAKALPTDVVTAFLNRLKLRPIERSYNPSYLARATVKVSEMVEHERKLPARLAFQEAIEALDPQARVYLRAERRNGEQAADLVLTGSTASFIAGGYTHYSQEMGKFRQWYVNPFDFLEEAFETRSMPKPDVTTAVGRRLYFSHVDGDGWRNWPNIKPYKAENRYAIDVIVERVIEAYPDLPVTVAPIAADLDPAWCGGAAAGEAAKRLFAMAHVEAASHTYSHPFFWSLFEHGSPAYEIFDDPGCFEAKGVIAAAPLPRAYRKEPFDLDQEITGAARYIERFLPSGKKVELLQWSGDTNPTASMLRAVADAGMLNINGGDARYDPLFPSASWVSPIGLSVQGQRQIYAAASNENTYTNLWTSRFYGFRLLRDTLINTEFPRRLKPINVYYHIYTGSKLASLNALLEILEYVRTLEIVPVWTSTYVRMAEGYYRTRLIEVGENSWRVENRGALQTIRFDDADEKDVSHTRSVGVLGWRRHHSSIYVALDPGTADPVVTLVPRSGEAGIPERPVLVHSRWLVENLASTSDGFSFDAGGFGPGDMVWQVPDKGDYLVVEDGSAEARARTVATSLDGTIQIQLPARDSTMRKVTVKRKRGDER